MADEHKPKQKRGRPFPKGETPPGAKPWLPGQSGNPAGASRRIRLVPILMDQLEKLIDEKDPAKGTEAVGVIRALVNEAKAGNVRAAQEVLNRTDGKVADKLDLGGTLGVYDLSKLSEKELEQLEQLALKAATES